MNQSRRPRLLALVPTYNEAENIVDLLRQLRRQDSPRCAVEVLVVDDASADGTGERVRELGREDPAIGLLERPGKLGLGTAYIDGFRRALEGGYDFVSTMDADFSHDPACLPDFIARALEGADLVIGSRYVPGGGVAADWGLHRRLLSAGANFLARALAGLRARDCTTGYRLYRCELLRRLDLEAVTSHGYSCLMELLYICQRAGARVVESPIRFEDRRAGESKISHREIFKAFGTLGRLCFRRIQQR